MSRLATIDTGTATLLGMLRTRRPAGSRSEKRFIRDYIEPLGVKRDKLGNLYKRIGSDPILWSCHTDTVHRQGGEQKLAYCDGMIGLKGNSDSNCLGADDTAGVFLMAEMIKANKPGLYIFHRQEEVGGLGSQYIAHKTPELLDGIQCAIALDRRGISSVITHQFDRCCSDTFGYSLIDAMPGMEFKLDSGGTFTDTANYTGLIGECTNLSVGYYGAHTAAERLDAAFLLQMRDSLLSMDYSRFEFEREAGETDWQGCAGWADDYYNQDLPYGANSMSNDWRSLVDLVRDNPEGIADILADYGMDAREIRAELGQRLGGINGR